MTNIVAEIVQLSATPRGGGERTESAPLIDTNALPDVSLVKLRGREVELAALDAAWTDPKIQVFSVVAWGGQGKTALVSQWVDFLKAEGEHGADALLAWSFYSQGTKERATSADRFLDWALKKLDLKDPGPSATAKAETIAAALKTGRVLLILDGVEPLQHGPGPQEGQLKDPAMRVLLRRVADGGSNGGLVLVTTRLAVKDIERWRTTSAPVLDLTALSETAGAALLEDRGVHGTKTQLHEAVRDFGGHALALTLLSSYLVELYAGDVRQRDHIRELLADAEIKEHDHAIRVLESYDKEWFLGAPSDPADQRRRGLMRAIMFMIGLFDRPASSECIKALRRTPAIVGFSEPLIAATDDEFKHAVSRLRRAGLLAAEDRQAPGALDAHPLAREWFGAKLKQENEAGWKAAHGRLYEHLRDTTKEGDDPDMTALEPLFQAIPHGCKAGRQQETLDDVFCDRICLRGPDGHLAFHAQNKLGAIGPSLAALAWFFDKPFETLHHVGLTAGDRSFVLGDAASFLAVLGRLGEARGTQRAALEMAIAAEDWLNAASRAFNLAESELALGEVVATVGNAAWAMELADRSKYEFLMVINRTAQAVALAAAGDRVGSRQLFTDAEALQAKWRPHDPHLYSLRGYRYCDFLLSENAFVEVADRAKAALKIAALDASVLDLGLDNASLGRAALGLALSAATPAEAASPLLEARQHLDTAIAELRRSNMAIYLPLGHLARAHFFRATGDFDAARRDLSEVLEIAEPGPMRLHLCDMHLELCRLALAERFCFAPLAPTPPAPPEDPKNLEQSARRELDEASKLIERCGYHKRDAERDELAEVIAGKKLFRDLPIRV